MTENTHLQEIENKLENLLSEKAKALPKIFNKIRFIQSCLAFLPSIKDIEKVAPAKITKALLNGAILNLDFFRKECYLIPDKDSGGVKFRTDYKGEIKICKRYSSTPIREIYAKIVRAGDNFEEKIINGKQNISFHADSFKNNDVVGAFAVVNYVDGAMGYETMNTEEIEEVRRHYSVYKNQAWIKSRNEMYRKTVLRRLCKAIDLDFDTTEQIRVFEESADANLQKIPEKTKVNDVFFVPATPTNENVPLEPVEKKEEKPSEYEDFCVECGIFIDEKTRNYSMKFYETTLCQKCQKNTDYNHIPKGKFYNP